MDVNTLDVESDGSEGAHGPLIQPLPPPPPMPTTLLPQDIAHESYDDSLLDVERKNTCCCCCCYWFPACGRAHQCIFRSIQGEFNLSLCLLVIFVSDMAYAIILPSLYSYSMSKKPDEIFYGIVVSAWCFGRTVSSPVLGWASAKWSYKRVLLLSLILSLCGDLIYGLAYDQWMILLGRFVNGLGSGSKGVIQAYFTEASFIQKSTLVFRMGIASSIAFGLGPGISAALTFVHKTRIFYFEISELNVPGLFSSIVFFYVLLLTFVFFNDQEAEQEIPFSNSTEEYHIQIPFRFPALSCLMVIVFLLYMAPVVFETIAAPLTIHKFGWTIREISIMWVVVAIGCCLTYLFLGAISKIVSDLYIFMGSTCLILIGGLFLIPSHLVLWRFTTGSLIILLSFPITDVVIGSLFYQIVAGNHTGLFFGLFTASSSLAKIVGPIWSTVVFSSSKRVVLSDSSSGSSNSSAVIRNGGGGEVGGEFLVFLITEILQLLALVIYLIIFVKLKNLLQLLHFYNEKNEKNDGMIQNNNVVDNDDDNNNNNEDIDDVVYSNTTTNSSKYGSSSM